MTNMQYDKQLSCFIFPLLAPGFGTGLSGHVAGPPPTHPPAEPYHGQHPGPSQHRVPPIGPYGEGSTFVPLHGYYNISISFMILCQPFIMGQGHSTYCKFYSCYGTAEHIGFPKVFKQVTKTFYRRI